MSETEIRKAGFCAIIGAPNAGKSTLTNQLVGAKVAIVTHKVQTTRFPVRGVAQIGDAQVVIVDTPGIFVAKRRLDRAMVKAAWGGADDADCIIHLIDASAWVAEQTGRTSAAQRHSLEDDRRVISQLKEAGKRAILALNKIDLFPHDQVLPVMAALDAEGVYDEIFMISAEKGDGLERLEHAIAARMPEGPALYPPDQVADLPMRLLAAEVTREKLMLRLHQELPYQLTVETEAWEERADGSVRIQQVVIVGRDGHKAMVLGKGGGLIKEIGRQARLELTEMLERPVHLFLFVKVDERWQERRETYRGIGLEFDV
ncbi:MAG: GTPase Era [Hyphomonas sp.]